MISKLLFHSPLRMSHSLSSKIDINKKVIILSGCTSVGKSAIAQLLSRNLDIEIISADSVQVYKHASVGANKPSKAMLNEIPHHLVDFREPNTDEMSSGDFVRLAKQCIDDILERGKTPVIVGGNTMWTEWLIYGLPDAPKATAEMTKLTNTILEGYEEGGKWNEAIDKVLSIASNKERFKQLSANDWYRLRRYLEIDLAIQADAADASSDPTDLNPTESSPLSSTIRSHTSRQKILPDDIDLRCFFLTEDRVQLYRTIDERCLEMLEKGLFAEVKDLILQRHMLPGSMLSKAIGYRQSIDYLLASNRTADDLKGLMNFLK